MSSVGDFLDQLKAYGQDIAGGPEIDIFKGGFSKSSAPFVIGKAAAGASDILNQGIDAQFSEFAEGYGQAERQRQDHYRYGLAEAGINPAMAQRMMAEAGAQRGTDVAKFRAGLEGARAEGEMGILSQTASGLIQTEQYQDSLDLQKYISDQQAAAAKKAGKYGMIGQAIGGGLNLLTGGLGGSLMGMFGGMGGGGGGGGGAMSPWPAEVPQNQPSFNFNMPNYSMSNNKLFEPYNMS